MGKGTRNRDQRMQDKIEHPEKYKEKKHAPKWLAPAISIVILVAIVFGVTYNIFQKNAVIERSRVLVKSETGSFNITQPMAAFLAWENMYYEAYYYYLYLQYGIYEDTNDILSNSNFPSAEIFAINQAYAATKDSLRDSVDSMADDLIRYVAVCDAAKKAGVSLNDEEKEAANSTFEFLESVQKSVESQYGFSGSANEFYSDFIFTGLKKSDIKKVNNLVSLYNKYYSMQKFSLEGVTDAEVKQYVTENPASFFSTDYVTYTTDNEEFANQLKAATDQTAFRTLILNQLFDKNVQTVYNQFSLEKTLNEELKTVTGKTNANEGTALNDAIAAIGMDAPKEYADADISIDDVKNWLFNQNRKQGDTTLIKADEGCYQVVFVSAQDEKVTGSFQFTSYTPIDESMKEELQKKLLSDLIEKPETPYVPEGYKSAHDRANELLTALSAEGANKEEILASETVLTDTITSETAEDGIPSEIYKVVTAEDVKTGTSVVDGKGVSYLLMVDSITESEDGPKVQISYVTYYNDLFYDILDSLNETISKEIPTENTYSMPQTLPEGGFEEWLMAKTADETTGLFQSERKTNDTAIFPSTNEDTQKTDYNVYMVINEPLYMKKDATVHAGYLALSDTEEKTAAEQADEAFAKINGKTGYDLFAEMNLLNSNAVSTSYNEASVSDADLSAWLFSADRQANDVAKISSEDGTIYVACFFSANESWYRTAKDQIVSNRMSEWLDGLSENYSINQKNVEKLGEASTTAGSETEATA